MREKTVSPPQGAQVGQGQVDRYPNCSVKRSAIPMNG